MSFLPILPDALMLSEGDSTLICAVLIEGSIGRIIPVTFIIENEETSSKQECVDYCSLYFAYYNHVDHTYLHIT